MKAIEKLRTERDNIVQKQQEIEQAIQCHRTELESLKQRISAAFVAGEPVDKLQQDRRNIEGAIKDLQDIAQEINTNTLQPLRMGVLNDLIEGQQQAQDSIRESRARVQAAREEYNQIVLEEKQHRAKTIGQHNRLVGEAESELQRANIRVDVRQYRAESIGSMDDLLLMKMDGGNHRLVKTQ